MILLALFAGVAAAWTPMTDHEACFNGWAEVADFRRSDAELVEWFRDQCADTRLTAFFWLQRATAQNSERAMQQLRQAEEKWVAENRTFISRRAARKRRP